jgi:hypothetical protein
LITGEDPPQIYSAKEGERPGRTVSLRGLRLDWSLVPFGGRARRESCMNIDKEFGLQHGKRRLAFP